MALRVRRDVWSSDDPWGDTLQWYERAVAKLKTLPLDDPRSWRYLAAMHGIDSATWQIHGYLKEGEKLPDLMETSWMQCQHTSWYFLPWHRGYLASFEAIIRETIVAEGGPSEWTLPYWNYNSSATDAKKLPVAFRSKFLSDGVTPNSLYVPQRYGVQSDGTIEFMEPRRISLESAFRQGEFTADLGGFGGPDTGFFWGAGNKAVGALEDTPHGIVHVLIGSAAVDEDPDLSQMGLMSHPRTAALDPIFWLHHANIDRLWDVWLNRDADNVNPTESRWVDGPPQHDRKFMFPTPSGSLKEVKVSQILSAEQLGYEYDDITDPLPDVKSIHSPKGAALGVEIMAEPSEFASNETGRIRLGGADSGEVRLRVDMQSAPDAAALESAALTESASVPRVYLTLDGIRASLGVPAFDVYVAAPAAAGGAVEHYVGTVSLFGVQDASDPEGLHGGGGLRQALEVTDAYYAVRGDDAAKDEVTVRFRKVGKKGSLANVSVGKVSLLKNP